MRVSRIRVDLIEKIEGVAEVKYHIKDNRVDFAQIAFFDSRYIENILTGRVPLDALAITPRVCGICGHAHLIATVRALESATGCRVSKKAQTIREITLSLELLQNHFKWFYLSIYPLILNGANRVDGALEPSRVISEAIALIAGQYPHNSYAIVGGISTDITPIDIFELKDRLKYITKLFNKYIIDTDISEFSRCDKLEMMLSKSGDLPLIMQKILNNGWQSLGQSYDRFIVFGDSGIFKKGKSVSTRYQEHLDMRYIEEFKTPNSEAISIKYRGKFYETGPLARAMIMKRSLVKEAHRRYKDSLYTRILARVCEMPLLIQYIYDLIDTIDYSQPSWIDYKEFKQSCSGVGAVEAARGSLIHKIDIKEGKIIEYKIITPTQWNLGNSNKSNPSTAQKALIGNRADAPLELIFKSFDVCSVCTVK